MNSGILPDEECQNIFNTKLKTNPSIAGISMKYCSKTNSYVLDRVFEKDFDFKNLCDHEYLPKDQGR
jgi:hypothetical protein